MLLSLANRWFDKTRRQTSPRATENSVWWHFIFYWRQHSVALIKAFVDGSHRFSPMIQYTFSDESPLCWCYLDRLMVKLILLIIKPTFHYIIASSCYHLSGPGGVKTAIRDITRAMNGNAFNYVIRADIKSYYASINRAILLKQLSQHYQDPRLLNYFEQIVQCAIDKHGDVFVPKTGIPRRSSLSPFFGALYLSQLDRAFTQRAGMCYFRYMDDIVILAKTKKQYKRARKIVFDTLDTLRLELSSSKTKMGRISRGFHFLGVHFEAPRSDQHQNQVSVTIHPRSCARALDRVNAMREDAVHPAIRQRYLIRWAAWWSPTVTSKRVCSLLVSWVIYTAARDPAAAWLGHGLLPWRMLDSA